MKNTKVIASLGIGVFLDFRLGVLFQKRWIDGIEKTAELFIFIIFKILSMFRFRSDGAYDSISILSIYYRIELIKFSTKNFKTRIRK